jgi:hypothetical protein
MILRILPGNTTRFHVVGHCDVKRPNIKLPLVDTKDATQNGAGMNANSHIQVHLLRQINY